VLPGSISGRQRARDIWQRRPRQRILLSTGYAHNHSTQQMGQDARLHILCKPFGRKDLAAAVRRTPDGKSTPDDTATQDAEGGAPA
jgi:ActR/RegA family two-component response regulator